MSRKLEDLIGLTFFLGEEDVAEKGEVLVFFSVLLRLLPFPPLLFRFLVSPSAAISEAYNALPPGGGLSS